MSEIDSLDIKIEAEAKQANTALDKLAEKMEAFSSALGKLTNNDAFKSMTKNAQKASEQMESMRGSADAVAGQIGGKMAKVGNSIKNIEKPVKEAKKSIQDMVKEISDRSVDIKPVLDMGNLTGEQRKYESQLRNMQNQLNRVLYSSSADKQLKTIERLAIKINEAKNALTEIKNLQDQTSYAPQVKEPVIHGFGTEEIKTSIETYKQTLDTWKDYLKNFNEGNYEAPSTNLVDSIKETVSSLKADYPEAQSVISEYEELLKNFSDIAIEPKIEKTSSFEKVKEEVEDVNNSIKNIQPLEFTGNFYEMEKWVDDLNEKLIVLLNKQEKLQDLGSNMDTQRMQGLAYDIDQITATLDKYEKKLEKAREAGELEIKIPDIDSGLGKAESKAESVAKSIKQKFIDNKIIVPTDGMKQAQKEIEKIRKKYDDLVKSIQQKASTIQFYGASGDFKKKQAELSALRNEYQSLISKQKELSLSGGYKFNFDGVQKSFKDFGKSMSSVHGTLSKLDKSISKIGKRMLSLIAPTKKAKAALQGMSITNAGLAKSLLRTTKMLKLMVVRMALRGIIDGVKTGMQNLAVYSDETNASLSLLMNSLNQLKNAFAAAVSPILNAFAPALNQIIQLCIKAVNVINQVISALAGKSTWIKAKPLTDNYRDSIDKTTKSAKELNKQLQGFDRLNNLTTSKNKGSSSGATTGTAPSDMFETVPIESKWKKLADKLKNIANQLFNPLKKAWDRVGKFVMDSWQKALKSVWNLIKSIGKDFLKVWNQEATIKIFENILYILGDIGLVVSNLADNFREAWEANDTGLHIFENIRDIIGVVIENIKGAADTTVEWSKNLDFSPLLTKVEEWTQSLIPVFDNLSGILKDFYENVLLPLAKWTVEKGLPDLLQVFIDFNEKVKWDVLRDRLAEFWKHLEPFAEKVGEGLILFIGDLSDAIAKFVDSEKFESILQTIEDWLDDVTAEDVAQTIKNIAAALVIFKAALLGFEAIKTVTSVLTAITTFLSFFGVGGGSAGVASSIDETATALGGLGTKLGKLGTFFQGGLLGTGAGLLGIETFKKAFSKDYEVPDYQNLGVKGNIISQLDELKQKLDSGEISAQNYAKSYAEIKTQAENLGLEIDSAGNVIGDVNLDFDNLSQNVTKNKDNLANYTDTVAKLTEAWKGGSISTTDYSKELENLENKFKNTEGTENLAIATEELNSSIEKLTEKYGLASVAINDFKNDMDIAGNYISEGLSEGMKNADTDTPAQGFFAKVVASIKSVFGIHSPAANMKPLGENIILGVLEGFSSKFENFGTAVTTLFNKIKSLFTLGLTGIKSAWTTMWSTLPNIVTSVFSSISRSVSNFISGISNALSGIFKTIGNINIPGVKIASSKIKGYASGGFVEPATYFKAGENGIPEMLGTVGGKTAVAGGAEITGISEAVYSTGGTQAQLLSTAIQLLQVIAEKDLTISEDAIGRSAKKYSDEYKKRTDDYVYS